MRSIFTFASVVALPGLMACTSSQQQETDAIAQAQQCLDQVPDSSPSSALGCLSFTSGYTSTNANLMNCSIYLTAGGINTTRMINAYNVSQNNSITSNQKQAVYISYLSFTPASNSVSDLSAASTAAQTAQAACAASGESGLQFVANMAVLGSVLNQAAGGITFDPTNPSSVSTAVQNALQNCQTTPANCQPSVIAPLIQSTATSYCASSNANQNVCSDVTQVEQQYGNQSSTVITSAMTCLLQGRTFTPPATCT